MKNRGRRFIKRISAVFLSMVLAVGMLSEMNSADAEGAAIGKIKARVTITIKGWDGGVEPNKNNYDLHFYFCPDTTALMNVKDGRSVEVTEYADVTKTIEDNKIIYMYTWPCDNPWIGSNTIIAVTTSDKEIIGAGQMGLDSVAATPNLDYNFFHNPTACLFKFIDGDQVLETHYYRDDTRQIEFPEVPAKDNQVFKGWARENGTLVSADDPSLFYTNNTYPMNLYATWESTGHVHNWDTAWENNADRHWHACTAAGCPVTDDSQKDGYGAHSWNEGTVTKEPTESETGERLYKCTVCGYEKKETIPVKVPGHIHDYGTEWKTDASGHWHECDCKDKKDEASHREGGGIITKEPTETETGIRSYPCADCGYVIRTEIIPKKENGSVSGNTPGDNGGNASGDNPGDDGGNASGNTPGDNSGNASGDNPGDNGGNASGDTPGDNGGSASGDNSGNNSGNISENENVPAGGSSPNHTSSSASGLGTGQGGGVSGKGQNGNEPKTGDIPRLEIYATVAMISGMLYLYLGDGKRGMAEEEKKEIVSRLIGWAKKGGCIRRWLALAAIFFLLLYYHSIGKQSRVNTGELCGE